MLDLLAVVLEAALLGLVYAALAWFFPREATPSGAALSPERRRAMLRVYAVGNIAILALAVPGTLLAYRLLDTVARAWQGSADHVLIAGWIFWALPALFLGILLAGFLVEVLIRWHLGPRYRDLREVMADHLGADPTRAGIAVSVLCLAIIGGLTGLFLQLSFVLDGEELRLDWPFHDPVVVKVSEVRWIREYGRGRYQDGESVRVVEDPHFRLSYGPEESDWWKSTEFHGPAGISAEARAAVEALAVRAGTAIERPEPLSPAAPE